MIADQIPAYRGPLKMKRTFRTRFDYSRVQSPLCIPSALQPKLPSCPRPPTPVFVTVIIAPSAIVACALSPSVFVFTFLLLRIRPVASLLYSFFPSSSPILHPRPILNLNDSLPLFLALDYRRRLCRVHGNVSNLPRQTPHT